MEKSMSNYVSQVEELSKYSFFDRQDEVFRNKLVGDSIMCWGSFEEPNIPLVSIIITTYKRTEQLKLSLESAINQIGFVDYEILVVDNEACNINETTPTSEYIEKLNNKKVKYFRHVNQQKQITDSAIMMARTEWILILHDDDILAPYALKVLVAATKNRDVDWISGKYKLFTREEDLESCMTHVDIDEYEVFSYGAKYTCTGYKPGWLGALFKREYYIEIKGMPNKNLGMGDTVMQANYSDCYNVFKCNIDFPTYYYRVWDCQESVNSDTFLCEYLFYKYCINRYFKYGKSLWNYITWRRISRQIKSNESREYHRQETSVDEMADALGIPSWWRKNGILSYCAKCFEFCYVRIYPKKVYRIKV